MESLRCFCRDLYVVTTPAALGLRQLSCAGVAEEGTGHVYSSPGTRQTLGHGTAGKTALGKENPRHVEAQGLALDQGKLHSQSC